MPTTHPPRCCAECGAALAADQRYCLSCGVRCSPPPAALKRILAGLPAWQAAEGAAPRPAALATGSSRGAARGGLPGPRTAAVLTLAMLAFGTVTGAAASNPSGALNALRRGPLTLLVPPPATHTQALAAVPAGGEETPTPQATPPSSSSEEPSSSEEASSGETHKHSHKSRSKGRSTNEAAKLPPVKHVFLIVLADQPYAQTFGPESPAPYIAHTLERRGELLVRFYGVAHEELADEVALISGLGPTPQTAADCPVFTDIIPGQANSKGQYTGSGCIYPTEAQTVGEQLTAKGLTWKVYAEASGELGAGAAASAQGAAAGVGVDSRARAAASARGAVAGVGASRAAGGGEATCWHPEFGAADPTSQAPLGDRYATFRNPFTYFDGVLHGADCGREDVGIAGLAHDLRRLKSTPSLSYIVPDLCHDGRPTPCETGAPSGLPAAEAFLRRVVPEILASPAYRHGGLLVITTDQAPTSGEYADSSSCCGQPRFPAPAPTTSTPASAAPGATTTTANPSSSSPSPATTPAATTTTPAATTTTPAATTPAAAPGVNLPPRGGGQVGALLISPYVKPGTFNQEPFNDFSLLRTIENLFGLPPLGYAATRGLSSLEASVFSAWSGAEANSS